MSDGGNSKKIYIASAQKILCTFSHTKGNCKQIFVHIFLLFYYCSMLHCITSPLSNDDQYFLIETYSFIQYVQILL